MVIASFTLHPEGQERWQQVWTRLREQALQRPGCREFRMLRNRHDKLHYAVLSEWDDQKSFDRFARDLGLVWLERGHDCACAPTRYTFFQAVEPPVLMTVGRVPATKEPLANRTLRE